MNTSGSDGSTLAGDSEVSGGDKIKGIVDLVAVAAGVVDSVEVSPALEDGSTCLCKQERGTNTRLVAALEPAEGEPADAGLFIVTPTEPESTIPIGEVAKDEEDEAIDIFELL